MILHKASLAQSLQLLPCLLLLYDGGEGCNYLLSELSLVHLERPITCMNTGLLYPKPTADTLLQLGASNVDPLVWSGWG